MRRGPVPVTADGSPRRPRPGRNAAFGALLVVVACAAAQGAAALGWLGALENAWYDSWHLLAGRRAEPSHVVIAAVDSPSLLRYRDEPLVFWGPHFARAIGVLRQAGARVIGVDYLFTVSAESWLARLSLSDREASRKYDIPLRTELARGGVVLIGVWAGGDSGGGELLLPIKDYLFSLPGGVEDVGLANFFTDADGSVRSFVPALFEGEAAPRLSFAVQLARRAGDAPPGAAGVSDDTLPRRIGYCGPPGTIPRLSFQRLLAADAAQDPAVRALAGKVVIVSSENIGSQDAHLTPYSRSSWLSAGRMMSGAEVHANIVETILTGRRPRACPAWAAWLFTAAVLGAATALFLRLHPAPGAAAGLALALAGLGAAYALFLRAWVLPVAGTQLGLAVCYLGTLAFRLRGEERTRTRLRRIFGRHVSDEVVEQLLARGEQPDLGGATVVITVLSADIRNFTTLSERLGAHEVVEMLNAFYTRVCECVLEQGGTVNKFIGDAVLALFGAPVPHPDHAQRAVTAALAISREASAFRAWMRQRFPGADLPEFAIGVGLHTGEAVVGNIGSPRRQEYTAIGDTVNTAFRIEGLTKPLGWTVVASRATIEAAGGRVVTGGRDRLAVKGRAAPVEVFEVIDVQSNNGGD
jgi:class 3 adenylate cyclase/CHASE2 domain-containing sensor protein